MRKYYNLNNEPIDEEEFCTKGTGILHWHSNHINNEIYEKEWRTNNLRHRIDGPAIEYPLKEIEYPSKENMENEYWINGKKVTKEQHDLLFNMMKLKKLA